jgi:hypothetical protein
MVSRLRIAILLRRLHGNLSFTLLQPGRAQLPSTQGPSRCAATDLHTSRFGVDARSRPTTSTADDSGCSQHASNHRFIRHRQVTRTHHSRQGSTSTCTTPTSRKSTSRRASTTTTAPSPACCRVAALIQRSHRLVVLLGAGVSVSAGLPDFRSPDSGLYSQLTSSSSSSSPWASLPSPEALFDLDFFRRDPRPFYAFCRGLWCGTVAPTPAHWFLHLLHRHGKLLRCYTQVRTCSCW